MAPLRAQTSSDSTAGGSFSPTVAKALLNQACDLFLPGQLDFRVFLGHPDCAVARDLRLFDARPTHLLPSCDVGASEGVRAEAAEIAALHGRRPRLPFKRPRLGACQSDCPYSAVNQLPCDSRQFLAGSSDYPCSRVHT